MVYQEIVERLDEEAKTGTITEYTKKTISTMAQKVLQKIAIKYDKVREGVGEVMGGKILEYEAKDILNQGKALGKIEGIAEGKAEGKAEEVLEFLSELGTISDELEKHIMTETDIERLKRWIKLAARSASVEEFVSKMNF